MPKPIDDRIMLGNMAEDILQGRAHTPTGAMRLHGVEDGSADERRLLRKWKDGGGIKAMEWAAHLILTATVERHREEMSQHGFREYERGYEAGFAASFAPMPPAQNRPRPSFWRRLIGVAG